MWRFKRSFLVSSSLCIWTLISARFAHAGGLQFNYNAPEECPSVDQFAAEVSERLVNVPASALSASALSVHIERAVAGFRGTLALRDRLPADAAVSESGAREVEASDCAELVQALALVAAVELSPDATRGVDPAVASIAQASKLALPTVAPVSAPTAPVRAATKRSTASAPWSFGARLGGSVDDGALPRATALPRLALFAALYSARRLGAELAISATLPSGQNQVTSGVSSHFEFAAVRLEGCASTRFGGRFELMPCALVEVGRLTGSSSLATPSNATQSWVAPGILLRGQADLLSRLALYADLGLARPLARTAFFLNRPGGAGEIPVYQVPPAAFTVGIGLLLHFP